MKRLKLAENNPAHYGLVDFADYQRNFATTDKTVVWTKETVWQQYFNSFFRGNFDNRIARIHTPNSATFGGNAVNNTPTQNYIDKFEMLDGTLYDPAIHDNDNAKRWDFRDPRLRKSVYVDRDLAGANKVLAMYKGGPTISSDNQLTPYIIAKFWPLGVDGRAGGTPILNFTYAVPLMRLAEVYLFYAEAANWAYSANGNDGSVSAPGANYTALGAVNKVRQRAGQIETTATGGAHGDFHTMIMNERAVEMCFEANQYWHDIRRYKIGESLNNTPIYTLDFDKDWTLFQRREILKRTFEKKHYWMPFPRTLTFMYEGFPQNEGWN
jgi:starch-binding outer membrane protein, SusD/RagB family